MGVLERVPKDNKFLIISGEGAGELIGSDGLAFVGGDLWVHDVPRDRFGKEDIWRRYVADAETAMIKNGVDHVLIGETHHLSFYGEHMHYFLGRFDYFNERS